MAESVSWNGTSSFPILLSDLAVGLVAVGLGICLALGGLTIRLGSGYDRIGPRFFPYLVAAGQIVTGSWLAIAARKRKRTEDRHARTKWSPLVWLGGGLLLSLVLLEPAGFVLSSSVLFCLVARSFRSARFVRDAGVALLLSTLVYIAFTKGLGLVLPAGVFGWFS